MASAFSDLNPIKNVWDALGRQVAGRNYPPTNKNTLIRALTEEWDKLPQQLLDNVVQSMVRRVECCITLHGGHIPFKGEQAPEAVPEILSDNKCDEDMQSNKQHQQEVLEEMVNEKANANGEDSDVPLICKDNPQDKMKRTDIISEETDAVALLKNKTRSFSCRETGTKSSVSRSRRRKCESESGLSNSTDDEGFEDKVIQVREKDLEKVIGHFVDKLIRESIATAVRSVNVDSVYDEVMKSVSRSQSESSDSTGCPETVQQKLRTDSVTEYADLRRVHTFEEDEMSEVADGGIDDKVSENSDSIQSINIGTEFSTTSSYPGNTQLQTDDESEGEETTTQNKEAKTLENADNCVITEERVAPPIADKLQDTSTQEKQDEDSTPKKLLENMDRTDIDESEVTSSQLQGSSLLTTEKETTQETALQAKVENFEVTGSPPQIEGIEEDATAKDTENISEDKPMDVRKHIEDPQEEIEGELKEIDGYHADCEESVSIHSLASESSDENVKQGQNCTSASVEREDKELCGEESKSLSVEADLMALSGEDFSQLLKPSEAAGDESRDLGENLPEPKQAMEEEKKVNWKVGYLHVKLPYKARGKGHLKKNIAIRTAEYGESCAVGPGNSSKDSKDPRFQNAAVVKAGAAQDPLLNLPKLHHHHIGMMWNFGEEDCQLMLPD
ncbi:uncharacterized protein TNCV_955891 [Trichonephila clavipes]|nr:uncharacterized protein TNCV_955891 [Trichonephila clavipes]